MSRKNSAPWCAYSCEAWSLSRGMVNLRYSTVKDYYRQRKKPFFFEATKNKVKIASIDYQMSLLKHLIL